MNTTEAPPPNRIRALREQRGWSLRDLGERLNIDFNTIAKLETGATRLDTERMRRIAQVFGLKASALLNDDDVEFRVDDRTADLMDALEQIPSDDRALAAQVAAEVTRLIRRISTQHANAGLGGTPHQVGALADIWNSFDDEGRARAVETLRLWSHPRA